MLPSFNYTYELKIIELIANVLTITKHKHIFKEIHHHILYRQHLREVPTETLRWERYLKQEVEW